MKPFRKLEPNEIDIRVQQLKGSDEKGYAAVFLLYKDARCDMRILDETVGLLNWKRNHELINGNLFCNVSLYDDEKKEWVAKQDVGTEGQMEKEKSSASDSFKRACFNWGIGRALYSAPFIYIKLGKEEVSIVNGKPQLKTKMLVSNIAYNNSDEISSLVIVDGKNEVRYKWSDNSIVPSKEPKRVEKPSSEPTKAPKQEIKKVEPITAEDDVVDKEEPLSEVEEEKKTLVEQISIDSVGEPTETLKEEYDRLVDELRKENLDIFFETKISNYIMKNAGIKSVIFNDVEEKDRGKLVSILKTLLQAKQRKNKENK